MRLRKRRPDSTLALTIIYELGPRSGVWEHNTEISYQENKPELVSKVQTDDVVRWFINGVIYISDDMHKYYVNSRIYANSP